MRLAGKDWQAIASTLQVARATAITYVNDALNALINESKDSLRSLRLLELERLDALYEACQIGITEGDPRLIQAALKIIEQKAKLIGLYNHPLSEDLNANQDKITIPSQEEVEQLDIGDLLERYADLVRGLGE